jgi:hypothetical protein
MIHHGWWGWGSGAWGMGVWGWIAMALLWVLVILGIVWLVRQLLPPQGGGAPPRRTGRWRCSGSGSPAERSTPRSTSPGAVRCSARTDANTAGSAACPKAAALLVMDSRGQVARDASLCFPG